MRMNHPAAKIRLGGEEDLAAGLIHVAGSYPRSILLNQFFTQNNFAALECGISMPPACKCREPKPPA